MAIHLHICLLVVIALSQVSLVLGRKDFYHYFFNHHHYRGSSTTDVPSSSTTGSSTTGAPVFSSTGLSTFEELLSSTISGGTEAGHGKNDTVQHYESYDYDFDRSYAVGRIVGIVFGSIIAASFFVGCCCFLCCASCRKPTETRGYVISNNVQVGSNFNPAQQISHMQQQATTVQYASQPAPYIQPNLQAPYTHQYQQSVINQHIPPEAQMPEFPPPYDTKAVQPQQYSTVHWQEQHSPMQQERQFSPVNQQIPTQPLIDLNTSPTAPGYEKN